MLDLPACPIKFKKREITRDRFWFFKKLEELWNHINFLFFFCNLYNIIFLDLLLEKSLEMLSYQRIDCRCITKSAITNISDPGSIWKLILLFKCGYVVINLNFGPCKGNHFGNSEILQMWHLNWLQNCALDILKQSYIKDQLSCSWTVCQQCTCDWFVLSEADIHFHLAARACRALFCSLHAAKSRLHWAWLAGRSLMIMIIESQSLP